MSEYIKKALVLGAGGFIGSHMVKRLKSEGYWVRGVDLKYPEFSVTAADEFVQGDLRDVDFKLPRLEFKGDRGNFYNSVPYQYIGLLMKSSTLLLIWVGLVLSLLAKTMLILCIILLVLI